MLKHYYLAVLLINAYTHLHFVFYVCCCMVVISQMFINRKLCSSFVQVKWVLREQESPQMHVKDLFELQGYDKLHAVYYYYFTISLLIFSTI